jgi:hypothetical protein
LKSNIHSSQKKNKAVTNKVTVTIGEGKQWHENCNDNEYDDESKVGATLGIDKEHEEEEVLETGAAINDESSPNLGRFLCGVPVLNDVDNPYHQSLKDVINPTTEKRKITIVLLNDLYEALLQGFPIDHVTASKKDLAAGYQLLKFFFNHRETLLAKNKNTW